MWADTPTDRDLLNYSEVADIALELIREPSLRPVSIGIFGTWGTGKSTLLKLIEAGLEESNSALARSTSVDDGTDRKYLVINFDAWLYQGYDDARAALMERITTVVLEAAKEEKGLADKAKALLKRVRYLRLVGLAMEGGLAAFGAPMFGTIAGGIASLEAALEGEADSRDVGKLRKAVDDIKKRSRGVLGPAEDFAPSREIDAFRAEFGALLAELRIVLVVFVDNLDRCLPKQTIHTLEALRLFLFLTNTAFVVAADEGMVRNAVRAHFKDMDKRHEIDYLDKIIQVPIRVPRVGVREVRAYLFMLLADASVSSEETREKLRIALTSNLALAWKEGPLPVKDALHLITRDLQSELVRSFQMADRMAGLLVRSSIVGGNPRIVKRLLNVVRMRSRLAKRRELELEETLIAKFALFERCTSTKATTKLYDLIRGSGDGRVELLADLEDLTVKQEAFIGKCPDEWEPYAATFLLDWFALEPRLAGVDLRPILHICRESVQAQTLSLGLSAAGTKAVDLLLLVNSKKTPLVEQAFDVMPKDEEVACMHAIIASLRRHTLWSVRPKGTHGAELLAARNAEAAARYQDYLDDKFRGKKVPLWLRPVLDAATWYVKKD